MGTQVTCEEAFGEARMHRFSNHVFVITCFVVAYMESSGWLVYAWRWFLSVITGQATSGFWCQICEIFSLVGPHNSQDFIHR